VLLSACGELEGPKERGQPVFSLSGPLSVDTTAATKAYHNVRVRLYWTIADGETSALPSIDEMVAQDAALNSELTSFRVDLYEQPPSNAFVRFENGVLAEGALVFYEDSDQNQRLTPVNKCATAFVDEMINHREQLDIVYWSPYEVSQRFDLGQFFVGGPSGPFIIEPGLTVLASEPVTYQRIMLQADQVPVTLEPGAEISIGSIPPYEAMCLHYIEGRGVTDDKPPPNPCSEPLDQLVCYQGPRL